MNRLAEDDWQIVAQYPGAEDRIIKGFKSKTEVDGWLNGSRRIDPVYLRLQADRCQRLSRSCMDLTTARDLRLMAEEYSGEASRIEAATSKPRPC